MAHMASADSAGVVLTLILFWMSAIIIIFLFQWLKSRWHHIDGLVFILNSKCLFYALFSGVRLGLIIFNICWI